MINQIKKKNHYKLMLILKRLIFFLNKLLFKIFIIINNL